MQALSGKIAHLVGNNREPSSLGTRPSCLDGGVQGDEIGEVRDLSDGSDESRDSCREAAERHDLVCAGGNEALDADQPVDGLPDDDPILPGDDGGGSACLCGLGALRCHRPRGGSEEIGGSEATGHECLQLVRTFPHAMGGFGEREGGGPE